MLHHHATLPRPCALSSASLAPQVHPTLQGLTDALLGEGRSDAASLGRRLILPASYVGGPRYCQEMFQNAQAMVRALGKPSYFLTMTCNPAWPEIQEALPLSQQAHDRPDLCCRVFKLKLDALMHDLLKGQVLGRVQGWMLTVEFQKRGLPHVHILLIMEHDDVPRCVEDYDRAISAEIPDPHTQPQLYKTVAKTMLHTCSPERCIDAQTRLCNKGFPKPFCPATRVSVSDHAHLFGFFICSSEAPDFLVLSLAPCAAHVGAL